MIMHNCACLDFQKPELYKTERAWCHKEIRHISKKLCINKTSHKQQNFHYSKCKNNILIFWCYCSFQMLQQWNNAPQVQAVKQWDWMALKEAADHFWSCSHPARHRGGPRQVRLYGNFTYRVNKCCVMASMSDETAFSPQSLSNNGRLTVLVSCRRVPAAHYWRTTSNKLLSWQTLMPWLSCLRHDWSFYDCMNPTVHLINSGYHKGSQRHVLL